MPRGYTDDDGNFIPARGANEDDIGVSESWWDKAHPGEARRVMVDGKAYWPIAPNQEAFNADAMNQGGFFDKSKLVTTPEGYIAVEEGAAKQAMDKWYKANKIGEYSTLDKVAKLGHGIIMGATIGGAAMGAAGLSGANTATADFVDPFDFSSSYALEGGTTTAAGAEFAGVQPSDLAMETASGTEVAGGVTQAPAAGGAPAVAQNAPATAATELMGPSALELGVPGATGYAAPYGLEASGGLLDRTIEWAKNNQVLASAGVSVAGGIIKGAMSPSPEEQANALMNAKVQAEKETLANRQASNRLGNLNVNRLRPTGVKLQRPGLISGAMK